MCYRMKVWRLPPGTPQSQGKALVNLLPLQADETITTILPLPEDQKSWGSLELMFATRFGNVRRNSLADFESINRNGKIAMKLGSKEDDKADDDKPGAAEAAEEEVEPAEVDRIVDVAICSPADDVLLTTAHGQAIRFPVADVRMFKGRDSTGVRGIRLDNEDTVISMAILHHVDASPAERAAYIKQAASIRRAQTGEAPEAENGNGSPVEAEEGADAVAELTPERYAELGGREQFVLTISDRGYGKRTSSYEYRVSGRGGKGIAAMIVNDRNGDLVASFPVESSDQIMLVSNGGQLIRCPVDDVRIAGRNTQGVRIFRPEPDEKVVSVERIPDDGTNGDGEHGDLEPEPGDPTA
jgi:DNA gyrase subunit A